jgi:hypothetical protein
VRGGRHPERRRLHRPSSRVVPNKTVVRGPVDFGGTPTGPRFTLSGAFFSPGRSGACGLSPPAGKPAPLQNNSLRACGSSGWMRSLLRGRQLPVLRGALAESLGLVSPRRRTLARRRCYNLLHPKCSRSTRLGAVAIWVSTKTVQEVAPSVRRTAKRSCLRSGARFGLIL